MVFIKLRATGRERNALPFKAMSCTAGYVNGHSGVTYLKENKFLQ
jgi:hypothetical protein